MGVNIIDRKVPGAFKDLKEEPCCFAMETHSLETKWWTLTEDGDGRCLNLRA